MWLQSPCNFDTFSDGWHCHQSLLMTGAAVFHVLPLHAGFQQQASDIAGITCSREISCSGWIPRNYLEQPSACTASKRLVKTDGRPCGLEAQQMLALADKRWLTGGPHAC